MNKKIFILFFYIALSLNFVFAQNSNTDIYRNISGGLDNATVTEISNTESGGLSDIAGYVGTMAAAAIITLVIFKLIEGAVLKGTFDNIYDQQKGNKIIKNAITSFLIFIFVNLLFTYINPDYGSWIFNTKAELVASKDNNDNAVSSVCVANLAYNAKSFEDQIKQDEEDDKFADKAYMDSKGYPTIGWGFNLDASNEPKKYLSQIGIKDTQLTNLTSCKRGAEGSKDLIGNCGGETITKKQADDLLTIELKAHLPAVHAFAGGEAAFNKLPIKYQNVIKNIAYAGDGTLNKFTKLKTVLPTLDKDKIAYEVQDSEWCKQTKSRCGRVIGMIYEGQCPASIKSINTTSLAAQTGSNTSVCKKLASVDPAKMVNIKTYLKGSVTCSENGGNPDKCMVNVDIADKLKKLDDLYSAKFNVHLDVISAYRSDEYQGKICDNGYTKEGNKCFTACKNGGATGSNHSLGNAVDLNTGLNVGCKKGASSCDDDKWKFIMQEGLKIGLTNKYKEKEFGHLSDTGQ